VDDFKTGFLWGLGFAIALGVLAAVARLIGRLSHG
jgi:hypothetical protein